MNAFFLLPKNDEGIKKWLVGFFPLSINHFYEVY
jgi:hypothetical protein